MDARLTGPVGIGYALLPDGEVEYVGFFDWTIEDFVHEIPTPAFNSVWKKSAAVKSKKWRGTVSQFWLYRELNRNPKLRLLFYHDAERARYYETFGYILDLDRSKVELGTVVEDGLKIRGCGLLVPGVGRVDERKEQDG